MNDVDNPNDAVQAQIEEQREQQSGLTAYRASHAEMVGRYSDAVTKIAEGRETVHKLRNDLRKAEEFVNWQERRKTALARRIQTGKAFIRAIEDDSDGVEPPT